MALVLDADDAPGLPGDDVPPLADVITGGQQVRLLDLQGGTRIASICVGAFILAAWLLDGLRATTHWAAAKELSRMFPAVEVDADVLFVDNGRLLTSAGAGAAGLDLVCT